MYCLTTIVQDLPEIKLSDVFVWTQNVVKNVLTIHRSKLLTEDKKL